jgi:hypothetical protein
MYNQGVGPIEYPFGLERTVLTVLQGCVGHENAISRSRLLSIVQSSHSRATDRQLRACINAMRKDGCMICSTGGEDGGYWLAASWNELVEFLDREIIARLTDLAEQRSALEKAGKNRWGWETKQERML